MGVYRRWVRLGLLSAALLTGMSGCVTTPQVDATSNVRLTVTASGTVIFLGRTLPLEDLGRALRHAGVRPHQEIRVQLDDPHNLQAMRRVTELLSTGGFQHVLFVSSRHASAAVIDADTDARRPVPAQAPPR